MTAVPTFFLALLFRDIRRPSKTVDLIVVRHGVKCEVEICFAVWPKYFWKIETHEVRGSGTEVKEWTSCVRLLCIVNTVKYTRTSGSKVSPHLHTLSVSVRSVFNPLTNFCKSRFIQLLLAHQLLGFLFLIPVVVQLVSALYNIFFHFLNGTLPQAPPVKWCSVFPYWCTWEQISISVHIVWELLPAPVYLAAKSHLSPADPSISFCGSSSHHYWAPRDDSDLSAVRPLY